MALTDDQRLEAVRVLIDAHPELCVSFTKEDIKEAADAAASWLAGPGSQAIGDYVAALPPAFQAGTSAEQRFEVLAYVASLSFAPGAVA